MYFCIVIPCNPVGGYNKVFWGNC